MWMLPWVIARSALRKWEMRKINGSTPENTLARVNPEQPPAATATPRTPPAPVGTKTSRQGCCLPRAPKAASIRVTTATLILAFTARTWFGLVTLYCSLRASREAWAIPLGRLLGFFSLLVVAVGFFSF